MFEILISHDFRPSHREILKEVLSGRAEIKFLPDIAKGDRSNVIKRADVLISWRPAGELSAEELKLAGRLRLIQVVSAGAERLPFALLPAGAIIASNPGAFAEPMAEHILGMVFALAKRLCVNHAKLKQGEFDQRTKNKYLRGSVLGVLGFGGIGQGLPGSCAVSG